MAINKVAYGNNVLIDLSTDTLSSADQLMQGVIAHDRTGAVITGTGTSGSELPLIIVDTTNAVGSAIVGTSVTDTSNYTPAGTVKFATTDQTVISGVALDYNFNNGVLIIGGVAITTSNIAIPTSATFEGADVKLINVHEEEES